MLSYLHCFLFSHCRLIFWLETCSVATYRWFVYQNIDLFSLYMSMLTSILLGLLERTIIILTPTCPWSSCRRQEGQERAGAVCVWGLLCLIGSVDLHVGSAAISLVPLRLIICSLQKVLCGVIILVVGLSLFLIHCVSAIFGKKKRKAISSPVTTACFSVQVWEETLVAVKTTYYPFFFRKNTFPKMLPDFLIYITSHSSSAFHKTKNVQVDFRKIKLSTWEIKKSYSTNSLLVKTKCAVWANATCAWFV